MFSSSQVNDRSLAGLFHHDVVKCLKELPLDVCIVCARRISGPSPLRGTIVNNVDPGKSEQAFASRVGDFHSAFNLFNVCFYHATIFNLDNFTKETLNYLPYIFYKMEHRDWKRHFLNPTLSVFCHSKPPKFVLVLVHHSPL